MGGGSPRKELLRFSTSTTQFCRFCGLSEGAKPSPLGRSIWPTKAALAPKILEVKVDSQKHRTKQRVIWPLKSCNRLRKGLQGLRKEVGPSSWTPGGLGATIALLYDAKKLPNRADPLDSSMRSASFRRFQREVRKVRERGKWGIAPQPRDGALGRELSWGNLVANPSP